jgi:hypothetical protein
MRREDYTRHTHSTKSGLKQALTYLDTIGRRGYMMKTTIKQWLIKSLREAAWAPLCIVGVYVFGLALDLYDLFPWLDIPTHLAGGMAITYFYRVAIRNSDTLLGPTPHLIQILFAFTATGTTTIFWEFYENTIDYFFGFNTVRGLEETVIDLLMGVTGALMISVLYHKR